MVHVVGGLGRGGIEVWLARVMHEMRKDLDVHIAVLEPAPWAMETAFAENACLYHLRRSDSVLAFGLRLRRLLKRVGPVDVVHSHVLHLSGVVVAVAAAAGVPVRIAHAHTDAGRVGRGGWLRRTYTGAMRALIRGFASHVAGSSAEAVAYLMGPGPVRRVPRRVVLPLAIEVQPVDARTRDPSCEDRPLRLGHVGRFVEAKNHERLVEVARRLAELGSRFEMWFIGDGPLRPHIEDVVARAGLGDRVRFLGERDDVDALLARFIDVFVFPSRFEGFGLAALEAQAAGLPCVISEHLPPALSVVPENVYRVDVAAPVEVWVEAVLRARTSTPLPMSVVAERIAASPYAVSRSARALMDVYRQQGYHLQR